MGSGRARIVLLGITISLYATEKPGIDGTATSTLRVASEKIARISDSSGINISTPFGKYETSEIMLVADATAQNIFTNKARVIKSAMLFSPPYWNTHNWAAPKDNAIAKNANMKIEYVAGRVAIRAKQVGCEKHMAAFLESPCRVEAGNGRKIFVGVEGGKLEAKRALIALRWNEGGKKMMRLPCIFLGTGSGIYTMVPMECRPKIEIA